MDRRLIRRLPAAAGILLATILLSTCSNSLNLLSILEDEVKLANNKYLVVKDFSPDNTSTNINPGASVTVQFDRALDLGTVSGSTVTVDPMTGIDHLEFSFNSLTNTLSIDAYPLYVDDTDYTVRVTKGVRGTDGSEVQNELLWAYQTGSFPNGSVKIKVGTVLDAPYVTTVSGTVTLVIATNLVATQYRTGRTLIELEDSTDWNDTPGSNFELSGFALNSGEGVKEAWVQFANLAGDVLSLARVDTIIRDTIPPDPPTWNLTSTTSSPSLDNTPTWYWIPSEGSAAMYARRLNGVDLTNSTLASYTGGGKIGFADDTNNYLEVAQQDAAGWWSLYSAPHYIYITPCIPLNGAINVSTKGSLRWRSQIYDLAYDLFYKRQKDTSYTRVRLERPDYQLELYPDTIYQWYVAVRNDKDGDYLLPATGYFAFQTK